VGLSAALAVVKIVKKEEPSAPPEIVQTAVIAPALRPSPVATPIETNKEVANANAPAPGSLDALLQEVAPRPGGPRQDLQPNKGPTATQKVAIQRPSQQ
jgi:hypothetical protein